MDKVQFVQCPTLHWHKYCFGCSSDWIRRQQLQAVAGGRNTGAAKVFCPSGENCPLPASAGGGPNDQNPWAFTHKEMHTILSDADQQRPPISRAAAMTVAPTARKNSQGAQQQQAMAKDGAIGKKSPVVKQEAKTGNSSETSDSRTL